MFIEFIEVKNRKVNLKDIFCIFFVWFLKYVIMFRRNGLNLEF